MGRAGSRGGATDADRAQHRRGDRRQHRVGQRLSYTIIGDSVNLASRLEGANKFYGTDILTSGATYEPVRDRIVGRQVDRVTVKGKKIPIDLYQILGTREEAPAELVEWAERVQPRRSSSMRRGSSRRRPACSRTPGARR